MNTKSKKKALSVAARRALKASVTLTIGLILVVALGWAFPDAEKDEGAYTQGDSAHENTNSSEDEMGRAMSLAASLATSGAASGAFVDAASSAASGAAAASAQDPFVVLEHIEHFLATLPGINAETNTCENALSSDAALPNSAALSDGTPSDSTLSDDIALPDGAHEVHWDSAQGVFGFELERQADEALAVLAELWHTQGWEYVPLGDMCGATFIKQTGTFRWMVVTCTQVGATTCIVGKVAR